MAIRAQIVRTVQIARIVLTDPIARTGQRDPGVVGLIPDFPGLRGRQVDTRGRLRPGPLFTAPPAAGTGAVAVAKS
jgi:hypothetical protein